MPRKPRRPTGNPRGRPEHVPNDVNRRLVTLGVGCRMHKEDIARAMGVSTETLNKYYQPEIAGGKAMTDLLVADKMIQGIMNGDTALIKYYMNNQMGFKEKADVTVENNVTFASLAVPEFNRRLAEISTRRKTIDGQVAVPDRPVLLVDSDSGAG